MFCPNGTSSILKFGKFQPYISVISITFFYLYVSTNQNVHIYILDVYLAPLQKTFVNRGLFIYLPDLLNLLPLHHPTV